MEVNCKLVVNQPFINRISAHMLMLILLIFFSSAPANSQSKVIPESKIPGHPRILLLKNEEKEILNKINTDSSLASVHRIILKECDYIIRQPLPERILKGRRLLEVSRETYRRIFFLAYAWRTTQNQKYLQRGEKELLAACAFSDWNPSHFLDVAEMTTAMAIGYDWFYGALAPSSKDIIKKSILIKGLKSSLDSKNNSWLTANTNWNQVCNAGMTLGALAIFEDDPKLCSEIINRAITSITLPMKEYDPDGNFPEGFGYWSYGTTYNVLFLSAIQKAFQSDFGLTANSGFLKTAYYMLHMIGSTGLGFNYSDNAAKGNLNPAMFWFADRLNDHSILFMEKNYLKRNKNLHRVRELPALMIWGKGINIKSIAEPKQKTWAGQGANPVAMLRTSWKSSSSIFVGLKAGSPYVNHGHMDVGEFVLDALGERWAMDFDPQSYSTIEEKGIDLWSKSQTSSRWQLYRLNNNSHSTLTINDQPQLVKGVARIIQSSDKPEFLSAVTDLTPVYQSQIKKAQRGVAIVGGKYVLVQDELEASNVQAKVVWKMLTTAQVNLTNPTTAELQLNNKKVVVKLLEPKGAVLKVWSTKPKFDYEDPNEGTQMLGFEFVMAPGTKAKSTIIISTEIKSDFSKLEMRPLQLWPRQ